MRYIFNFPDIGEGLDEGTILQWYVNKGELIKPGDPLVKIETDKVVADIPSPKSGTIAARFGEVGDTIKVGTALVEIEMEGVFASAAIAEAKTGPDFKPQEEGSSGVVGTIEIAGNNAILPASDEGNVIPESKKDTPAKVIATPVARAMAKELGIEIEKINGTGPGGRITKEDIRNFNKSNEYGKASSLQDISEPAGDITYEPLTQIRKTIAKNMINSKHNAAHMSLFEEVEISELIWMRERLNNSINDKELKITYLPFIIKATVKALQLHRQLNSEIDTDNGRMIYKNYYNIGIAVDTNDGLVVPVIRNADKISLAEIALKISELTQKARNRSLVLDEIKDGTFTITNYGSIGGIFGVPVINYPQAAILGIGRILQTPVVKDDSVVVGKILPLSLSVDHRIVDGGEASRFVNHIKDFLSDPFSLVL